MRETGASPEKEGLVVTMLGFAMTKCVASPDIRFLAAQHGTPAIVFAIRTGSHVLGGRMSLDDAESAAHFILREVERERLEKAGT